MNPPAKKELTPEEKTAKAHKEDMALMQKQLNELKQLVLTQQDLLAQPEDTFDTTIDHLCHTCPAVSMGKFDPDEQAEFIDLKHKSSGYTKTRPINFMAAIRQLFIHSIKCKSENCPYTNTNEFLIDEYKQLRENLEGQTVLHMSKKAIPRFAPLQTPKQ